MKYRPHFNGWRTDHIKTAILKAPFRGFEIGYNHDTIVSEAYNSRNEGCLVQSIYGIQHAIRQLMSVMKNTNIKHRLKQNYARGRVPFITHRQLLKYQGFSGRPKKVLQKVGIVRGGKRRGV